MNCGTGGKRSVTRAINNVMKGEERLAARKFKVLLLGTGDSGKSTVFKQMKLLYGTNSENSITNRVLKDNVKYCLKSILKDTYVIIKALSPGGRRKADIPKDFPMLGDDAMAAADIILGISSKESRAVLKGSGKVAGYDKNGLQANIAQAVSDIWNDTTVQHAWNTIRSKLQVSESYAYFATKVSSEFPKFGGPGWIPTEQEYLLTRNQTTGVHKCEFLVEAIKAGKTNDDKNQQAVVNRNQSKLLLIDVGGQKAERRKWVKVFDGVPVVLFITAISEYDQVLWEDLSKNRLADSLEVFDEIVNYATFSATSFIMFLNKADVFREKLCDKKIELNRSGEFPDAPDTFDFDAGVDWMRKKFKAIYDKDQGNRNQSIIFHVTTATDRENAKNVLKAVAQTVFTQVIQPWFGAVNM